MRRGVAADQLGEHGQLAARDLDPGQLGPAPEPLADLPERLGVGLLHRHVVEQGDRLRAHADHVVGVHGHEVDAHRVEAPQLLADDHLRAHAVAGQGQAAALVEPQHVRVVARTRARPATGGRGLIPASAPTSAPTASAERDWSTPERA